jgi:oligosaccharide repeat unit polymerase
MDKESAAPCDSQLNHTYVKMTLIENSRLRTLFLLWLDPRFIILFTCGVSAIIASAIPERLYLEYWGISRKAFNLEYLVISALCILCFITGSFFSSRKIDLKNKIYFAEKNSWRCLNHFNIKKATNLINFGTVLTIVGYVVWVWSIWQNGMSFELLRGIVNQEEGAVWITKRITQNTIPGITTLTQLGPALSIIVAVLWRQNRNLHLNFYVVLIFAFIRAIIVSERVALIEILIPFFIIYLQTNWNRIGLVSKLLAGLLPFCGLVGISLLYGGFEYFRGWTTEKTAQSSIVAFSIQSVMGYYVSSFNNGAALMEAIPMPICELPYTTLNWLFGFPLIGQQIVAWINPSFVPYTGWYYFIIPNENLNSPCGLFGFIYDFGLIGGLVAWVIAGFLAGSLFRLYAQQRLLGLIFYSYFIVGLLEVPRTMTWTAGRNLPTWAFLYASYLVLRKNYKSSS